MTATDGQNSMPPETASGQDSLAGQLSEMLNRQIALARAGKVDEILILASETEEMISRADPNQLGNLSDRKAIRDLYDKLRLILGAASHEISKELGGLRKGRISLKAYKTVST